jgi:hypothetical protein
VRTLTSHRRELPTRTRPASRTALDLDIKRDAPEIVPRPCVRVYGNSSEMPMSSPKAAGPLPPLPVFSSPSGGRCGDAGDPSKRLGGGAGQGAAINAGGA